MIHEAVTHVWLTWLNLTEPTTSNRFLPCAIFAGTCFLAINPAIISFSITLEVGPSTSCKAFTNSPTNFGGDLVTMKWWDDLWLNESFATFMAYKATDSMFPQWTVWQDFVRGETAGALER